MNQTSAQKQTEEVRDNPGVKAVDMKLEVVVIPVSDPERAEQFLHGVLLFPRAFGP